MIADLKPYPAMKDSGVPWLGAVPEHWVIERLKSSMTNVIEQTAERQDTDLYVALEHVESWTGRIKQAAPDVSFESQVKRFQSGDVLFGKLRPYLAKVTRPASNGVCVGEFFVLRPHDSRTTAPYVEQLLRSKPIIDAIDSSTFGARMPRADWRFLGGMAVPLPPLPEQAAIVRFLDHVDRRIRRYIRAKQKLIKLLEEQKKAVIHHAVTRGLDPNVPLKPSGVEWLGDVPEHWEVLPIKRAFVSMDYGISESSTDAGTIRLLTMGNIKNGRITVPETGGVALVDTSLLLDAGDLLFNRTNSSQLVGKVGLFTGADSPVTFASYLVRMRPRPAHEPEYLNTVLNDVSVLSIARREAIPSLHQSNLNPTRYGRLQVSLPPLEEQQAILQGLKAKTSDLDRTIAAAHYEVSLLREYRTRLIADVVTGKLDVREAAANLPDEVPEPLEDTELPEMGEEDIVDSQLDADILEAAAE